MIPSYHKPVILFERLPGCDVPVPFRGTPGSAGLDFTTPQTVHLRPGQTQVIPSGFKVHLPWGTVGIMCPRSSIFKRGLEISGKIDCDYRGEVGIMVRNETDDTIKIEKGERLAQMVVVDAHIDFQVREGKVDDETARGTGGFGSTGR